MANISDVGEDPFGSIDLNETEIISYRQSTLDTVVFGVMIFATLTRFFLGLVTIGADVFLIFVILKFKRLKKKINFYIMNFAICNIVYYTLMPCFLLIHALINTRVFFRHMYCLTFQLENVALIMCVLMIFCLGLDWFIISFHPYIIKRIKMIYDHVFLVLYGLGFVKLMINITECYSGTSIHQWILLNLFLLTFIGIGVLYYLKRGKSLTNDQMRYEYAFKLSLVILSMYAPAFIYDILLEFLVYNYYFRVFLELTDWIPDFIVTSNAIVLTYLLGKFDKHFKMAYDSIFKRSVRAYGSDNLDDASDNEEILGEGKQDPLNETLIENSTSEVTNVLVF